MVYDFFQLWDKSRFPDTHFFGYSKAQMQKLLFIFLEHRMVSYSKTLGSEAVLYEMRYHTILFREESFPPINHTALLLKASFGPMFVWDLFPFYLNKLWTIFDIVYFITTCLFIFWSPFIHLLFIINSNETNEPMIQWDQWVDEADLADEAADTYHWIRWGQHHCGQPLKTKIRY